jgi:hypothetical protein
VEDGKLRITAHDLCHRTVAGSYLFSPRKQPTLAKTLESVS